MIEQIREIAEKYLVPYTIGEDTGYRHPKGKALSISESEGRFMYDLIKKHNLKNGYEIATGTGYSSLWLTAALGHLMSLDDYTEDGTNVAMLTAMDMYENLDYGICVFHTGESPGYVGSFVKKYQPFDCVFIDGNHYEGHPALDYGAIRKFLELRCIIFWHDWGCPSVGTAIELAVGRDGFEYIDGFQRLAVIGRGL